MKKRLLLVISLVFVVSFVFAISVSAEKFNLTYYQEDTEKETVSTNENGEITLRDTGYSTETSDKTLLGWFTYEGDMYKPGETITLTKDTKLYQFFGFKGTQKNFQTTQSQWSSTYIQLQEDVVFEKAISCDDGGKLFVDLNGYTITSSAGYVFYQRRAGLTIVGEGSIIHTGKNGIFGSEIHGYDDRRVSMYVGKNVKIETSGVIYDWVNSINSGWINSPVPFEIYGDITCKQLMAVNGTTAEELNIVVMPQRLEITGESLFSFKTYPEEALINVQIGGLTFLLNESANTSAFWNNDNPQSYNISVVSGTYTNGGSIIEGYLSGEYAIANTEIDGVTYTTVISKGECTHEYEITGEQECSCIVIASKTYTCKSCQNTYTITYGDFAEHKWVLINDVPPTPTTGGEKTYECSVCQKQKTEKYYVDVANEYITVTVNTADGEKEISVKVSDVLDLEAIKENEYILRGIKAFGDYLSTDIVSIGIPLGIFSIEFNQDNQTLRKIDILDSANVTVKSFAKFTGVTEINIGASSVVFSTGCSNKTIKSIYSNKKGADVKYETKAFSGIKSLENVTFATDSDYILSSESFGDCIGIKEIILPDYCRPVFKGSAFWQNNIEYIYVGRGITSLDNDPFNRNYKLKKAVLMDVNKFPSGWTFCYSFDWANDNDPTTGPAEIYIHSSELTLANDAFHQSHGVTVYTNAPITHSSAFSGCQSLTVDGMTYPAYTIVYGIPHKYVETYIEPTCTEQGVYGYKAECPCGELLDGAVTAEIYYEMRTNGTLSNTVTYVSEKIPASGHTEGKITFVEYMDGYMSYGLKDCICKVCNDEYTELYPSAEPMFTFLGYSMPEDGGLEISIGFVINTEMISMYEGFTDKAFEYGVVVALADKLNGKAPLDEGAISDNVALVRSYTGFSLRVSGFTDAYKDLGIVMAMYVKVTDGEESEIVYLQGNQTELPKSISINQYLQGK